MSQENYRDNYEPPTLDKLFRSAGSAAIKWGSILEHPCNGLDEELARLTVRFRSQR